MSSILKSILFQINNEDENVKARTIAFPCIPLVLTEKPREFIVTSVANKFLQWAFFSMVGRFIHFETGFSNLDFVAFTVDKQQKQQFWLLNPINLH